MGEQSGMRHFEVVASDRHGYGYQPQRFNGIPAASEAEAIAEARYRYGKETGLDSDDIDVELA